MSKYHWYGDEREDYDKGYEDARYHTKDWDRDRWNDENKAYFEGQEDARRDEERREEERQQEEEHEAAMERARWERQQQEQAELDAYYEQQREAEYYSQVGHEAVHAIVEEQQTAIEEQVVQNNEVKSNNEDLPF